MKAHMEPRSLPPKEAHFPLVINSASLSGTLPLSLLSNLQNESLPGLIAKGPFLTLWFYKNNYLWSFLLQ